MESTCGSSAETFEVYVKALTEVLGHADRAERLRDYCTGLMMPVARKSVEPLAAVTAPARVSANINRCCISWGKRPGPMKR